MAERDTEKRTPGTVLLVGAGRLAREAGAVLATLSGLDDEGARTREPWSEVGMGDLEELMAQRPREGVLILESGRVPGEDIGFVRRFLERHPGWRLVVVGEDRQDGRVRALLALERAAWLRWPPDLEELRALLAGAAAQAPARAPEPRVSEREPRALPRRVRRSAVSAGVNGGVDVGDVLEELLASAALQGEGAARYQFQGGDAVLVPRERGTLVEGLGGLVELARACAGADGLVRAAIDPSGDAVVIGLEFPRASLPEADLSSVLERGDADEDSDLHAALDQARHGVEVLREAGGRVDLASAEPGRVRCEVRLSARPAPVAGRGRSGKPEDPFA